MVQTRSKRADDDDEEILVQKSTRLARARAARRRQSAINGVERRQSGESLDNSTATGVERRQSGESLDNPTATESRSSKSFEGDDVVLKDQTNNVPTRQSSVEMKRSSVTDSNNIATKNTTDTSVTKENVNSQLGNRQTSTERKSKKLTRKEKLQLWKQSERDRLKEVAVIQPPSTPSQSRRATISTLPWSGSRASSAHLIIRARDLNDEQCTDHSDSSKGRAIRRSSRNKSNILHLDDTKIVTTRKRSRRESFRVRSEKSTDTLPEEQSSATSGVNYTDGGECGDVQPFDNQEVPQKQEMYTTSQETAKQQSSNSEHFKVQETAKQQSSRSEHSKVQETAKKQCSSSEHSKVEGTSKQQINNLAHQELDVLDSNNSIPTNNFESDSGRVSNAVVSTSHSTTDCKSPQSSNSHTTNSPSRNRILMLEKMVEELKFKVSTSKSEHLMERDLLQKQVKQLQSMKRYHQDEESQLEPLRAAMQAQKAARSVLESRAAMLARECDNLRAQVVPDTQYESVQALQQKVEQLNKRAADLQVQLDQAHCEAKRSRLRYDKDVAGLNHRINELCEDLSKSRKEGLTALRALARAEVTRAKLHEEVMTLRGNIRVYCRLRPCVQGNLDDSFELPDGHDGGAKRDLVVSGPPTTSVDGSFVPPKRYKYSFDRVFGPEASQTQVFQEGVSALVQSAIDGHNVCIFAYGQTGSGKTHTMFGHLDGSESELGIIPRSVAALLCHGTCDDNDSLLGKRVRCRMSVLEIYNENIYDLLGPARNSTGGKAQQQRQRRQTRRNTASKDDTTFTSTKSLNVRHNSDGTTCVPGLDLQDVSTPEQVMTLLRAAIEHRAVAKTDCNERSSRSHTVFSLHLDIQTGTQSKKSVVHLVDLAGSERLSESGSTRNARMLKETQAINSSLSTLANTINALAENRDHIPYRNSKLTYLLQNALGGTCKTLMLCNISPEARSVNETICTLRFASKVNECSVGGVDDTN